jgi:dihydroorotase
MGQKGEELSEMDAMAPYVAAFSDDGKGVQSDEMMLAAMEKAKSLGKLIAAHCEDNSLLNGGYIHDGEYARANGHKGICSASEYEQIARDLRLVEETGCAYHVCHISTKESVELIRQAKAKGLNVTCETGPHYLVMDDSFLQEDGRFRMNPPIRSEEDRQALVKGIQDGTIDMIATDHAPHSAEEKGRGLEGSAFGIVGIETAFAAMYTHMVLPGLITLERLIELLSEAPRKRFGIPLGDEYTIWDLNKEFTVDPKEFISMGKATPFAGWKLQGECLLTVCDGKVVYKK